jgi:hypothetical protein
MSTKPLGITANSLAMSFNGVSALGLPQSFGSDVSAGVTAEARDGNGSVAAATYTDWRSVASVEYIPYDNTTFPSKNDIVQVSGFLDENLNGAYRVTAAGETYTNQGYPAKRISLIRYLDLGVPYATTTTTTTTT